MKTNITKFFKKSAIVAFSMVTGWANAATFTAVTSGAWSSAATWGGTAPGGNIGGIDNVVINSGVNVTMDMDVTVNSLFSSMEVNGTLTSSNNFMLDINNGVLSGNGTLTLGHLRFGALGSMSFTGTSEIDNLHNNNLSLSLVNQLHLNDTLFLEAGNLSLGSGGFLTLESGSVIRVEDGSMSLGAGTIANSSSYSVLYVGSDKNTGLELMGTGLNEVWIDMDDNTQSLSIVGNVTINGTLHHNTGDIDLNGGTLTLMGDYMSTSGAMFMGSATSNLHIMAANTPSNSIVFDASADELNNLWVDISTSSSTATISSDLTIHGTITANDGTLRIDGGTLTMTDGSNIEIGDGKLTIIGGGSFDGSNEYDVTYNGNMATTSGIELTGSGLQSLTVDMDDETDSVEIMNDVTINGTLDMQHGALSMNGYDLTLEGSFSSTSGAWINADENSNLTFNTTTLIGDTLWVNSDNNVMGNLTINSTDGSYLRLGSELYVEDLTMSNGGVMIFDNTLYINSTGTVSGADDDNYIMIMGNGTLGMTVPVSAPYTMFPVGTEESYTPAGIQQNSGISRYFEVNVTDGVWAAGTSGDNNALTESVVDRTWNVSMSTAGSVDINMIAQWAASDEVNGFDRTSAYISHYTAGSWDSETSSVATSVGTMFQLERESITSLSPFAVVDENASVSVPENNTVVMQMYPNPVQNVLTCIVNIEEPTTVDLVDLTGKVLFTERINGKGNGLRHNIDFTGYPNGVYFVRYNMSTGTTAYKIVKS